MGGGEGGRMGVGELGELIMAFVLFGGRVGGVGSLWPVDGSVEGR